MAAYKGKTVDPNKPKRPPTAYFLFLADFRPRMAGKGIEHKELLKLGMKFGSIHVVIIKIYISA